MKIGTLVQIKKEWLNPNERQIPYVVVEDNGDRVNIRPLPCYVRNMAIIPTETVSIDMLNIIDDKNCIKN